MYIRSSADGTGLFPTLGICEHSCPSLVTVIKPPLGETKEVNTTSQGEVSTIGSSKATKGRGLKGVLEEGPERLPKSRLCGGIPGCSDQAENL